MFLRQPGFSLVIVLTLAIGIGANTAIFSLVDALLLRSLPVTRPHELAQVFQTVDGEEDESFSYPTIRALDGILTGGNEPGATAFTGVAGFSNFSYEYGELGSLRSIRGAMVTGAYYETLGVRAAAGRVLTRADDEPGAPLVAVISDGFWAREFGRRADAVGAALRLNGKTVIVVGVSPPGFTGANVGAIADVTMPAGTLPQLRPPFAPLLGAGVTWMRALARPAPGIARAVAVEQINAAWPSVVDRVAGADASDKRRQTLRATTFRLDDGARGWTPLRNTYREPLMILMAAVALLLTIACANVASLLLARASARRREIAVRLALGAGRWRVLRQMLIESVLVSLAGAAAGVPVAWLAGRGLVALIAKGYTPVLIDVAPDGRVLAFAAAVALISGVTFGLAPALRATASDPSRGLREDLRTSTSRSKLLPALVVLQVALSFVLVAAAGLFVRTFANLQTHDTGFAIDGVIVASLGDGGGATAAERLADLVRAVPGVSIAGLGTNSPLDGSSWTAAIGVAGQPLPDDETTRLVAVGPGYIEALGMRVLAGRPVREDDRAGAPRIAVINDVASRQFFGASSPIGQQLSARLDGEVVPLEIVGLVRGIADASLREAPHATVYLPLAQQAANQPFALPPTLVVRAQGPVEPVRAAVQRALQAAQPDRIVHVDTLRAQLGGTIAQDQVMATLAGTFGVVALALAALGLYGLLSYTVARRSRELGIRLALGAHERGVVALVVTYGGRLVLAGVVLGVPIIWAASRWIESMLFGVTPADPVAFAATAGVLLLAAGLATFMPARRAARLDPLTVLRRD
jgi:predicted permease